MEGENFEGKQPPFIVRQLKDAFITKNREKMREYIDYLQKKIESGSTSHCSQMGDSDLDELLEKGKGTLYCGSGTHGQRVFFDFNIGKVWMPYSEKDVEIYGNRYHLNFASCFELPFDSELTVTI